jgi:hypothetical protein
MSLVPEVAAKHKVLLNGWKSVLFCTVANALLQLVLYCNVLNPEDELLTLMDTQA